MFLRILLSMALILGVAGCATHKKGAVKATKEELQTRVTELETELQKKDERITALEEQSQRAPVETTTYVEHRTSSTGSMSHRDVQTALKNAGFYSGAIDGQIGKQTKRAIKEFQRSNGLVADGVIGPKTKAKLRSYLNQ